MVDAKWLRPGLGFALGWAGEELGELQVEVAHLQAVLSRLQLNMGGMHAAIGKTNRFGLHSPDPRTGRTNAAWLERVMSEVSPVLDEAFIALRPGGLAANIQVEISDAREAIANLIVEMNRMGLVT